MIDPTIEARLRRSAGAKRNEMFIADCEVAGAIPSGLRGAFVRVGGEWFYPPRFPDDAPLHADGYVSAFNFAEGRVSFRGRFVRTPRYEANLAAGRQLFGYYRNRLTDDPNVQHLDGTVANTAPFYHGGRLFTLKEDTIPYQLDPDTLDTIGPWNFGGDYKAPTFTAHPRVDPLTGEMVALGYEACGPASDDVFLYTFDAQGQVTHEARFKQPYTSMIHDMAITQEHVIIPCGGYVTSPERLARGEIHWGWDRSKPSHIGIIPRGGDGRDMRWFRGPERCMMHVLNARTEGDRVILEAPFWESNFFPFFPNVDGSPFDPSRARAFIRRLTFDLSANKDSWDEEILFDMPVSDLAKIDDRYLSLGYRYAFTNFNDTSRPPRLSEFANSGFGASNSYGRFDMRDRTLERFFVGDTHHLQECCFIPRSPDAPEADGWLMGVATNYLELRSELVIVDTARLSDGEVARVLLPVYIGSQVHGTWVSEPQIEKARSVLASQRSAPQS